MQQNQPLRLCVSKSRDGHLSVALFEQVEPAAADSGTVVTAGDTDCEFPYIFFGSNDESSLRRLKLFGKPYLSLISAVASPPFFCCTFR